LVNPWYKVNLEKNISLTFLAHTSKIGSFSEAERLTVWHFALIWVLSFNQADLDLG